MSLIEELKQNFPEVADWNVEQGDTHEKERINQNTETTKFLATSPDKKKTKSFVHTNFTDYRGNKKSWREADQ